VSLDIDPAQLALRPRPKPSAHDLAVLVAAVQLTWPQPGAPDELDPVHQPWRFSGRWWNKPTPLRRDRPWARG
jgi:hypothetical protein